MRRLRCLRILLLAATVLMLGSRLSAAVETPAPKPNIVLIFIDDRY